MPLRTAFHNWVATWVDLLWSVRSRVRSRVGQPARRVRSRRAQTWKQVVRRRLLTAGLVFAVWTVAIEARLIFLQVFSYDELMARAEDQQQNSKEAIPKRGEILDRHGRILAYSVDGDAIYAEPRNIDDSPAVTALLCDAIDCSDERREALEDRLAGSGGFAYVKRQAPPDMAKRVAQLDLTGVGFLPENRRYYPNGELAAHVLGYVGIDNKGLGGIESTYDSDIRGRPGLILFQADSRGRAFSRLERPPTAGATLELTIDAQIQYVAERELERGVHEHGADAGCVVITDPYTGDILAMANWPTFNPNLFADSEESARRNRCIQDIYEPGSTFKIVTAAAALEEGVASRTDLFDVSAGQIRVDRGPPVKDMHVYQAPMSFDDVIIKSSNVGAVKIGLRLGAEGLSRYIRRFGFGEALARDLPGQARGIVHSTSDLESARQIASVSIGYAVSVTPLQVVAAASAVANGGELLEPRLVRAVIRNGLRAEIPSRVVRRSIKEETAVELREIMEGVSERGTAKEARVTGYPVAGKTGTTKKLVEGKYSDTDHVASFVGFVPSRRPEFTMIVMVDNPRGARYTGGAVAAPIFRRIAEAALRHRAVAPTVNPEPPIFRVREGPERSLVALASTSQPPAASPTPSIHVDPQSGLMPDLRGMSARQAIATLGAFGMIALPEGDGVVTRHQPPAGSAVDRGATVTLQLERRPRSAEGRP